MRRFWPALLVACLSLLGCSSSATLVLPSPTQSPLQGYIYLVGGRSASDSRLFELDAQLVAQPLYRTTAVRFVSACRERLLVSASRGPDPFGPPRLFVLDHGGSLGEEVADLTIGDGTFASAIDAAPDCRLVYLQYVFHGEAVQTDVLYRPADGMPRALLTTLERPSSPAIAGSGLVGVLVPARDELVLVEPDGSRRSIQLPIDYPTYMRFSTSGWLTIASPRSGQTLVLDEEQGQRALLNGWWSLAWSPNGRELLLRADKGDRKTLAVWSVSSQTIRPIGRIAGPIPWGAVWVPRPLA